MSDENNSMVSVSNSMIRMRSGMKIPKYETRKTVGALKIKSMRIADRDDPNSDTVIEFEGTEDTIRVNTVWRTRFLPVTGGYVVWYESGHVSFSPAEPFEKSASRIDGEVTPE